MRLCIFSMKNKFNLGLIFFSQKSRREGGSSVLEIQTGGGSYASGNQGEWGGGGGLKNDLFHPGVCGFFLE